MGRPNRILPTPELMGVVASRRLREPVIGVLGSSFTRLDFKKSQWKRYHTRQKLTAANITLHRIGKAYSLTLNLSPKLSAKLNNPCTAQATFDYVRDQLNRTFKAAGESRPVYWYVLENLSKHAATRNTFTYGNSSPMTVEPHIHAVFSLLNPRANIDELSQLLKKNLGGGRPRSVCIQQQGTREGDHIEPDTLRGLLGPVRYACKNIALRSLWPVSRPFVLSRALQQETISTLNWLSYNSSRPNTYNPL
ncbi:MULTISPECIES: hypothetical protein [unclassified Marinobacter]|uniref:hypothetical protein n=1 Tax=unclassified Marinobacter TaxID=83889 RepID=UPI0019262DC0|nr:MULTISPECIES: hypothetical protein [unclassified Marinobacter]MBL3826558.1 hypothetical protein [Marinobacter sp. MC3]MBL3894925.1 hypothetical protein [Marinobacter sp. MW3]